MAPYSKELVSKVRQLTDTLEVICSDVYSYAVRLWKRRKKLSYLVTVVASSRVVLVQLDSSGGLPSELTSVHGQFPMEQGTK